ncbi:hypothetical protein HGRIS_012221 [Hohenbuehelia grisea]|uniref:Uncharacterized protein n=1 Tax=Hohenbuehelia grisea TaxID=104357 RepID=A0ABR3IRP0_9AGAR
MDRYKDGRMKRWLRALVKEFDQVESLKAYDIPALDILLPATAAAAELLDKVASDEEDEHVSPPTQDQSFPRLRNLELVAGHTFRAPLLPPLVRFLTSRVAAGSPLETLKILSFPIPEGKLLFLQRLVDTVEIEKFIDE